ncbi:MAG: ATP-binding cassette domain-containing protein [Lachnospiraceae bacterium]|nr:ATP-binding cassette domain-containing protein [Lachnospiraceae bacterium]
MKIDVKDVTMIYSSGKKALSDVSFSLKSPEFVGILGPNGAGKSTLMKLMTAGLKETKGEILLDDKKLLDQEQKLKSRLGYLPQSFGLFDELTVWQFLDYMAALKGIKDKSEIEWAMEQTGLSERRKIRVGNLSGGQKQRVGIAQAIMGHPELMILDEPTVGLDPEERVRFRNIFSEMSSERIVFLSTHIVDDVQAVCNRVLVIYGGRILFDGSPAGLIEQTVDHVGSFIRKVDDILPKDCEIVSRINTRNGVLTRIVAGTLPDYVDRCEPSLEDAYLYCIHSSAKKEDEHEG